MKEISMKNLRKGTNHENWKIYETKKPESTRLADKTRGITTKQTKLRSVASAASHPITPAYGKIGKFRKKTKEICIGDEGWVQ